LDSDRGQGSLLLLPAGGGREHPIVLSQKLIDEWGASPKKENR